jgi:hypothetical protein
MTTNLLVADYGLRDDDFNTGVVPGEMVMPALTCAHDPCDGECARAFQGLSSGKHTNLARVNHLDLTSGDLVLIVSDQLAQLGIEQKHVMPVHAAMLEAGSYFSCGAQVERRGDKLGERGAFDDGEDEPDDVEAEGGS